MSGQTPFLMFEAWFAAATAIELNDPNAMTVATATPGGLPSARIVLLKDWDHNGFVFYTNTMSRKGHELAANQNAALLFHWKSSCQQIRIEGRVEAVTDAEADTYYNSRPRNSRLGAWASIQSAPLPNRDMLQSRIDEFDALYPGEAVPRPPHWSGYRLVPSWFEFWQDMPFRLHDRATFTLTAAGWTEGKLFP